MVTVPKFKMRNSGFLLCCQALIPVASLERKSQWLTYAALAGGLNIAPTLLHRQ